jgi:MFS transporter, DHA2 family, methylenomycin A resistance protein
MRLTPLIALCLGFFMVIMDATIINVILPSLAVCLPATLLWLQWIVDAYTVSFACLLLGAGHLSDQWGAKRLFQWGILFFALSSCCCGLATSPLFLTLCRLWQGMSAAFIVPTSLALIHSACPNASTRAKAFGIWGAVGGIAAATGPVLGAGLTTIFNWRAVFFINLPIAFICYGLTKRFHYPAATKRHRHFDFSGLLLGILCVAALVFSVIESGQLPLLSPRVILGFSVFVLSLIFFIIIERRAKHPMRPLFFLKNRRFVVVLMVGAMINFGFYGMLFVLPLYFQQVRGYSVIMLGFALVPLTLMVGVSSYLSGKLVSKIGTKWPMVIGLFSGGIGFLGLLPAQKTTPTYAVFVIPFLLIGLGIAFTMPAATMNIMQPVSADKKGVAAGAFNTSRQLGSVLGVAILGALVGGASSFVVGLHVALALVAGLFLGGLFVVLFVE